MVQDLQAEAEVEEMEAGEEEEEPREEGQVQEQVGKREAANILKRPELLHGFYGFIKVVLVCGQPLHDWPEKT